MIIGIPKELKNNESRVALTPSGAAHLVKTGQEVLVEASAGDGSGFTDEEYRENGATILHSAKELWERSDMIMKVKEPLPSEYPYLKKGLILFAYLHLAAAPQLAQVMLEKEVTGIAYETISVNGKLPLLAPMSEVAGRMAVQIGARYLEKHEGGSGILLSGVPGVEKGTVTIIGGGAVGENAARIALGIGARVTILDLNPFRLRELAKLFGNQIQTLMSTPDNIGKCVLESNIVIGCVLIPGRRAPKLVTDEMVRYMKKGSVIVDVAIDQGGNFETINQPTSHEDPIFVRHGVLHYAVPNIPGAVPRTSTIALTNDTVPYVIELSQHGVQGAIKLNPTIQSGLNTYKGYIVSEGIANDLELPYKSFEELCLEQD